MDFETKLIEFINAKGKSPQSSEIMRRDYPKFNDRHYNEKCMVYPKGHNVANVLYGMPQLEHTYLGEFGMNEKKLKLMNFEERNAIWREAERDLSQYMRKKASERKVKISNFQVHTKMLCVESKK